eukprot:c2074_g1_i1 orf=48-212(-)
MNNDYHSRKYLSECSQIVSHSHMLVFAHTLKSVVFYAKMIPQGGDLKPKDVIPI